MTSDSQPSERDLWRHADFLRLWAAQAVSAFGSRITRTALPIIAVATLHQRELMISVLAAMQLVPGMIMAVAAGGVVDRGHKRRILIIADLVRAALVASLTLAWELGALTMPQLIIVGAGVGAASALFQITDTAYLPQLIGRRRLTEGNAKLETTEAVAEITGPASAGVLITVLGAPLAVVIDALSYVWSAVMLGRIRGDAAPAAALAEVAEAAEVGETGALRADAEAAAAAAVLAETGALRADAERAAAAAAAAVLAETGARRADAEPAAAAAGLAETGAMRADAEPAAVVAVVAETGAQRADAERAAAVAVVAETGAQRADAERAAAVAVVVETRAEDTHDARAADAILVVAETGAEGAHAARAADASVVAAEAGAAGTDAGPAAVRPVMAEAGAAGADTAPSSSVPAADAPGLRTGQDFRIGLRAVFGHPLVRPLILTLMLWSVTGGFFTALYTPFCLRALGLPASTFGIVIAMGGVGSLGGAMLARGLARVLGVGRTLIVAAALSVAFTLFIPIAGLGAPRSLTIGFLVLHQLFGDGFAVAYIIVAVTLRQTVLPRGVLGRANAAIYVSTTGVLVISALIAGVLALLVGIQTAMWIGTLIGLTAPLLLWPLRRLREMPSGDTTAAGATPTSASATSSATSSSATSATSSSSGTAASSSPSSSSSSSSSTAASSSSSSPP